MKLDVVIPIEVSRGQNNREHHHVRAKRVKAEREATSKALFSATTLADSFWLALANDEAMGARVTLLRPYARIPLDTDNLSGAFKGVRDEVAAFLGVDDRSERIHWRYCQVKADKRADAKHVRCRIEIVPAADVDPMRTAVRWAREHIESLRSAMGNRLTDNEHTAIGLVLDDIDRLATFDPQELYNV